MTVRANVPKKGRKCETKILNFSYFKYILVKVEMTYSIVLKSSSRFLYDMYVRFGTVAYSEIANPRASTNFPNLCEIDFHIFWIPWPVPALLI